MYRAGEIENNLLESLSHSEEQKKEATKLKLDNEANIFRYGNDYVELWNKLSKEVCNTIPETDETYVEKKNVFIRMRRAKFNANKKSSASESLETGQGTYESVQKVFRNVSFLIQGILAGLLLGDALYTFTFVKETLVLKEEQMSLPIHAALCVGCTIACISVLDELAEMKNASGFKAKRERAFVALALWTIGLAASALSISADERISPAADETLTDDLLWYRQLLCFTRSLAALGAWIFITYGIEVKRSHTEIRVAPDK